ncbi:ferrous iron transport protein B [Marinoscillum furvescens]|uniref:Ferrous iron transport protein B n=1 Tax=Marinoscillum furvescens DSM 4134 TaxID=1122208 RepID=A0A3D9L7G8_MARFU|nr:ferrous iron transport protein B [Marinoscillum furvescens]REE00437.1 ferrous iron transport protein B [Marinoscillum furvescens DSM 4134]
MKIALVGNPNSGKTSVFNQLTGLNQKVGNFPGVTVDKKVGYLKHENVSHELIDLPGIYSLYPKTQDEEVVYDILRNPDHADYPDRILVVVDASNLERNLLLFTQVMDLGVPVTMALNMTDVADRKGLVIDTQKLSEVLGGIKIVPIIARTGEGMEVLMEEVIHDAPPVASEPFLGGEFDKGQFLIDNVDERKARVENRYKKIRQLLTFVLKQKPVSGSIVERHRKVDKFLTHPVFGYLVFLGVLLVIFQAIFAWAEWPMDLIDTLFLSASAWVQDALPPGVFTDLLAEGIIPGLGGVVIFIPQITLLFAFIFILEETGYMSRVVFILDRFMRPFGLNGRSVVPLISGVACAIPAIMATRTIDNWKERLITIMVTPLMSCSARLPVYTLLIALVVPDQYIGPFNLKGLVLLGLYLIGLVAALLAALVSKWIVKSQQKSFLVMELPLYKMPRWNNLVITLWEKVRLFVFDAGKVIFSISIILWVLASYGPGDRIEEAVSQIPKPTTEAEVPDYEKEVSSVALANSYIGIVGHAIEPAIRPLGYNWQIGIALITSFAAREVFVGSMATIYSIGEDFDSEETLIQRMRNETNRLTGEPVYTLASGLSLMIFYAFAMQCMSTLAIVLRETKNWKYPFIQLVYMTGLAYVAALITYQLLS